MGNVLKMKFPGMAERIHAQMEADGIEVDDGPGELLCEVDFAEDGRTLLLTVSYKGWCGGFEFPDWLILMARAKARRHN